MLAILQADQLGTLVGFKSDHVAIRNTVWLHAVAFVVVCCNIIMLLCPVW
jgi:hypothetical protein